MQKITISAHLVAFGRNLQDNHQTCNFLKVKNLTCKFLQLNHPS